MRWRSGITPLQEVAVTTDGGSLVRLAGCEAQHESLKTRRILRILHCADNALNAGSCLLDVPDLHFFAKRYARWQCLQIAVGCMELFQLDIHFKGFVENLMVKRLTMSRIG